MARGTDAVQMLVNLANGLNTAFTSFILTVSTFLAVAGAITYLCRQAAAARKAPGQKAQGAGNAVAWILLCGSLAGLDQLMGAAARQLGWSGVTFDAISYVNVGTFGTGAQAANAVLTLIRMFGVYLCLRGVLSWRRSQLDGHTGLSASEDVSRGTVKFVLGVLCVCNPYLLDALQKSLGML